MTLSFVRLTRHSFPSPQKSIPSLVGSSRRIALTAAAVLPLLTVSAWSAEPTAQTDLASIVVTPLAPQAKASASDWRTIYDYSGGSVLPPGTRITATGKWIEPRVREDKSGVTFSFPDLPAQPQAAQDLNVAFAVETPLANYPTRGTIHYTALEDQIATNRLIEWPPFRLTTAEYGPKPLADQWHGYASADGTNVPVQSKGDNTLIFTTGGPSQLTATLNGQDVSDLLARGGQSLSAFMPKPGAMLLPGLALRGAFTQQPNDKGDWFAVNSFKIEQLRPPLELSSVAAVDLRVPGMEPIRATIEITDDKNDSKGYLLRDALVSPGTYRLYWDGIDQKQSQPKNTSWIAAGSYSFRLTTNKTNVSYAGEINNSAPKFNRKTYGMVNCTSLAMTPPGTTLHPDWTPGSAPDERKLDPTDSVQLDCVSYDACYGQWVGADGTVFSTKTGGIHQQHGRGMAITPPDPEDPTNTQKQFYFVSRPGLNGDIIMSYSLPTPLQAPMPKILTSPDWNRPPEAFLPFRFEIGRLPYMAGPQKYLFFQMSKDAKDLHAEWIFRNVRLYEEGQPDPGPMMFDATLFTPRLRQQQQTSKTPVALEGVSIEDNGNSVHVKNSGSLNYPINYTITPHTILAFDLDVIDHSGVGTTGNGIGVDVQSVDLFPGNQWRYMNFTATVDPGRFGIYEPALGAYCYPFYAPNTLYTDSVPLPPREAFRGPDTPFLWQPGFYGVNVSEDGRLLFACNNADNRLEVRDISSDGSAIAKIPINYPMFAAFAPDGADGAPSGSRYIYITSPKEGIVRITWKTADNTFGPPMRLTPASKFAYPRGIAYDAVSDRIFVCDTFNLDRSQVANQIAVIDPQSGEVLSRFGKRGGVNPSTGGAISDDVFTCPLNIAADSKGALWINDYYSCEVRKYDFKAASNTFTLERRVLGTNTTNTSHFYWMPGDPPTRVWTFADFLTRVDADLDSDGRFVNPRTTSAVYNPLAVADTLRPYAHFQKVGKHSYAVLYSDVYEQVNDGWVPRFQFGTNAGRAARDAGLLAQPGQPPTDLDKAIAASGDTKWEQRPWAWSDLDGDGKMEYSDANPEFQIAFNSSINFNLYIPRTGCLRATDGAFVCPAKGGLAIIPAKNLNGKTVYSWENAKLLPLENGDFSDVLAQDGRFYGLRCSTERHDMGDNVISNVSCFDESGKLLWTRDQNDYSLMCLQSLGDNMISIMDRGGWSTEGPVFIRTGDGDLVSQIFCQEAGDCWSNGALRSDRDTAYIGMVQAYKVTGLSTVKTAVVNATLPAAGP
jgi:hypothetical protein